MPIRPLPLVLALVAALALGGCELPGAASPTTTTEKQILTEETMPPTSTTSTSIPVAGKKPGVTTSTTLRRGLGSTATTYYVGATTTTLAIATTSTSLGVCPTASQVTAAVDRWTTAFTANGTRLGRSFGTWVVMLYGHVSNASSVQISVDMLKIIAVPPDGVESNAVVPVPNVGAGSTRQWVSSYRTQGFAAADDGSAFQLSDWTHTVDTFTWSPVVGCK